MKKLVIFPILITIFLFAGGCKKEALTSMAEQADNLTRPKLQSVLEFIGSDLFEGRAPGTRGGDLAEEYIKSLFKLLGLSPGTKNGYLQPFVLKGFTLSELEVKISGNRLEYLNEIVGTYTGPERNFSLTGDAIFVGFGITAAAWDWDDYKDADVRDKIVITRVNDPGMFQDDIFEGKVLTYFGRWTYHIEEAARRGAAGILLIHTNESAGYGWDVVKNSWSGEELYLESDPTNRLRFRGWVKESSLTNILSANNIDLNNLYAASQKKGFKPVDLGFKIGFRGLNKFRKVINNNVIGEIPGKSNKKIVLSAHIDHLGMNKNRGDNIFNGAIDNGSAVAAMVLAAEILKDHENELDYTITVLACNAEEAGLLGSRYFIRNTDRENIIANINFESTPVWKRAKSIMGIGARFSTFEDIIQQIAAQQELGYSYFSLSNQGLFFRSDQFSFARYGIPSVWISAGEEEIDGSRNYTRFWSNDYHTVRDEFNPAWELEGLKQTIRFTMLLINHLNKGKIKLRWKDNLSFPIEK